MLQITELNWTVAPSIHWLEAFGYWLKNTPSQKRRERSRLTRDAYLNDVRLMAQTLTLTLSLEGRGEWSPDLLNDADLKAYFQELERECKPATYNRKLASVRMLISWAREHGLISDDPAAWIPFMDATRKSPRDVDDQERSRLEEAAEAGEGSLIGLRDSVLFFLMDDAGLRINEVVTLRICDVHPDDGQIELVGKGKKQRLVKIGSRLAGKIQAWLERKPDSREGTLITDESGNAIGREQAWRRFTAIAEKAGVKVTPHAMRHTYVLRYLNAYMQGDPWRLPAAIDAVCQQTGDRPEVILAYYTRARESDMRAAAEAM